MTTEHPEIIELDSEDDSLNEHPSNSNNNNNQNISDQIDTVYEIDSDIEIANTPSQTLFSFSSDSSSTTKDKNYSHSRKSPPPLYFNTIPIPSDQAKTYFCRYCYVKCASEDELLIHTKNHSGFKPFKCTICTRTYLGKTRHSCTVIEQTNLNGTSTEGTVTNAMGETIPRNVILSLDNEETDKETLTDSDILSDEQTTPNDYLVEKRIKSIKPLPFTISELHKSNNSKSKKLVVYQCTKCQLFFKTKVQICIHMRVHLHKCNLCGGTYPNEESLQRHKEIHKRFQCKFCSKSYKVISNLMAHERKHKIEPKPVVDISTVTPYIDDDGSNSVHLDEIGTMNMMKQQEEQKLLKKQQQQQQQPVDDKPFECNLCWKSYKTKPGLTQHIRWHRLRGEKYDEEQFAVESNDDVLESNDDVLESNDDVLESNTPDTEPNDMVTLEDDEVEIKPDTIDVEELQHLNVVGCNMTNASDLNESNECSLTIREMISSNWGIESNEMDKLSIPDGIHLNENCENEEINEIDDSVNANTVELPEMIDFEELIAKSTNKRCVDVDHPYDSDGIILTETESKEELEDVICIDECDKESSKVLNTDIIDISKTISVNQVNEPELICSKSMDFNENSNSNSQDIEIDLNSNSDVDSNADADADADDTTKKRNKTYQLFKCVHCGKLYKKKEKYIEHLNAFKISINDETIAPHTYIAHSMFECDICSQMFTVKSNMKRHRSKHNLYRELFVCDICSKEYFERNLLNKHKLMHDDSKSYNCEQCSKKFLLKSSLISHMLTHV